MKVAIEINVTKLLIVAGMALSTWLSILANDGTVLVLLIPAGIYGLFSKEV